MLNNIDITLYQKSNLELVKLHRSTRLLWPFSLTLNEKKIFFAMVFLISKFIRSIEPIFKAV